MTALELQIRDAGEASTHEENLVRAWTRRKPAWNRTDTARWLSERSEPLLAWLRRRQTNAPAHSRQMGYWLKENATARFNHAHQKLAVSTEEQRSRLTIDELMR